MKKLLHKLGLWLVDKTASVERGSPPQPITLEQYETLNYRITQSNQLISELSTRLDSKASNDDLVQVVSNVVGLVQQVNSRITELENRRHALGVGLGGESTRPETFTEQAARIRLNRYARQLSSQTQEPSTLWNDIQPPRDRSRELANAIHGHLTSNQITMQTVADANAQAQLPIRGARADSIVLDDDPGVIIMPIDMSYTPITPEIADEVLNKTPTITLPESRIESTERNLEPHL